MKRLILTFTWIGCAAWASAQPIEQLPRFGEVYQLLRSNQSGLTDEEIDAASVRGLLDQLSAHAVLATNAPGVEPKASNLISQASVLEKNFGYYRFRQLERGLEDTFRATHAQLTSSNQFKGIVLDLRYAMGTDYAAAARTADQFIGSNKTLLRWGDDSAKATSKTNAVTVPVAILVNRQTAGAAEALAAMLREANVGLIIGTNTAGSARVFKEFTLKNGDRLKIASAPVKLGNGKEISAIQPDIELALDPAEAKAFYENPYRELPRAIANPNTLAANSETNRPRRRLNEAELVRLQREGLSPEDDTAPITRVAPNPASEGPVLSDPALIRALDLLKGLAVIQQSRRL